MDDERTKFATSIAAMALNYPSLKFRLEERDGKALAVWEGWLQPIRTRAGLNSIVCDLDEDRAVAIDRDTAAISHYSECGQKHKTHRILDRIKNPDRRFLVRIEFNGGPAHPQGYLINPVVTSATRFHIFGTNRICAYAPQADVWRATDNNVADFTDHVLVWLFKWNTRVETCHWLGSEEAHDPIHLISTIRLDMQCWCASGQSYERCCFLRDKLRADKEVKRMLEKRGHLYQTPNFNLLTLHTLSAFLVNR